MVDSNSYMYPGVVVSEPTQNGSVKGPISIGFLLELIAKGIQTKCILHITY